MLSLEVAGPRYRDVNSALKTCAYCGTTYLPSSRNDREAHRQVHRETQRLLDPGPNKRFAARLKCGAGAERVVASVPMWMHQEVLKRAQRFRSDFAYDFVQWPGTMSTKATADWHGYLIPAGADGTIAGACAFLYETETKPSGSPWTLSWIWLAPKYRRGGLLRERWGDFLRPMETSGSRVRCLLKWRPLYEFTARTGRRAACRIMASEQSAHRL